MGRPTPGPNGFDNGFYRPPGAGQSYEGDTNSTIGFNKEALHAYRAGAEVLYRLGTLKPAVNNIGPTADLCDGYQCQAELRIILREAIREDFYGEALCSTADSAGTLQVGGDKICVRHRTGSGAGDPTLTGTGSSLNPYVLTHEIGHAVQSRWSGNMGSLGRNGDPGEGSQRAAVAEGFANFTALATWYSPNDPDVNWMLYNAEGGATAGTRDWISGKCGPGTACTCADGELVGESRETQFFWDLYDPASGDDSISHSYDEIRKVWSEFPAGTGDNEYDECPNTANSDGVNAYDYADHYQSLYVTSIDSVMASNCMDRHWEDGTCE